ncbi:MAG: hypothetical protein GTN89_13895, partial [Acidobacteria bacterium]|nr:hypothetical protein [Acidobacteriota bacterium]NIQ31430.1 hypothetical protein [Acidobacteriota bacterium]NIQ85762.1 hypothetical protein [Acidobacteriota bacterium]
MKKVGSTVLFVALAGLSAGIAEAGWEGRSVEELLAAWGEPAKTKRHGEDGRVLIYRLRFLGKELVGHGAMRWSDLGIGPSPVDKREESVRRDLVVFDAGGVKIGGD